MQSKVCVGALQEYPGSTIWYDWNYLCPECNTYGKSGDTQVQVEGDWHWLCEKCEKELEKDS